MKSRHAVSQLSLGISYKDGSLIAFFKMNTYMRPLCHIVFMQTSIFNEWIERVYINFKIAFLIKGIIYIRNIFKNNTDRAIFKYRKV